MSILQQNFDTAAFPWIPSYLIYNYMSHAANLISTTPLGTVIGRITALWTVCDCITVHVVRRLFLCWLECTYAQSRAKSATQNAIAGQKVITPPNNATLLRLTCLWPLLRRTSARRQQASMKKRSRPWSKLSYSD